MQNAVSRVYWEVLKVVIGKKGKEAKLMMALQRTAGLEAIPAPFSQWIYLYLSILILYGVLSLKTIEYSMVDDIQRYNSIQVVQQGLFCFVLNYICSEIHTQKQQHEDQKNTILSNNNKNQANPHKTTLLTAPPPQPRTMIKAGQKQSDIVKEIASLKEPEFHASDQNESYSSFSEVCKNKVHRFETSLKSLQFHL